MLWQLDNLQIANILQLANITKENGKEDFEYQTDKKTF